MKEDNEGLITIILIAFFIFVSVVLCIGESGMKTRLILHYPSGDKVINNVYLGLGGDDTTINYYYQGKEYYTTVPHTIEHYKEDN